MTAIKKTFEYGGQTVTLETSRIARQADGAVLVTMGDVVVLVTVVGRKSVNPSADFFPLTVNYQERAYAAGKVPGGFLKREGRPSERETLTSRLIDRPIRPLFPKGFLNEVQVIATVVSTDAKQEPDIAAMIGTSAALAISGIPFAGPIGAARVGYRNADYLLNPSFADLSDSDLDMVVAGTANAVLMVESEANILPEQIMLGAVAFAHQQMQAVIEAVNAFATEAAKPAWDWQPAAGIDATVEAMRAVVEPLVATAYQIKDKLQRLERLSAVRAELLQKYAAEQAEAFDADLVVSVIEKIEKQHVRQEVLAGKPRIDGRDTTTVRPIQCEVSVLPRTHGSALFTRGETQALVVVTLGTSLKDAQLLDALEGESKDTFMLHYNFPPYCVGETGFMSSPKRREIGHGRLARRGVAAVLPSADEFSYVLRVVSEITESNGSSSMASVCGTSLALMDAGVPIKAPVSGIAMGLVKEGDDYVVLSDILGDEDHLGDMDFKVAGTAEGITALQMDIKIDGITEEIMAKALAQAQQGRLHILEQMAKAISSPRQELSTYAPRLLTIQIPVDKIRDVIGKGGAVIRGITEETGAVIEITDDGVVTIASADQNAAEQAQRTVLDITSEPEVGEIYAGKVVRLVEFGAFVSIAVGKKEGLLHISQIANKRIEKVTDVLVEGQAIKVRVLEIDRQGRIRLGTKDVEGALEEQA